MEELKEYCEKGKRQMNIRKVESQAIEHYGVSAQVSKAIEEASELIRALCRFQQKGMECSDEEIYNIREEIADVEIMCDQMEMVFGNVAVQEIREKKLERLSKRMEGEEKSET